MFPLLRTPRECSYLVVTLKALSPAGWLACFWRFLTIIGYELLW